MCEADEGGIVASIYVYFKKKHSQARVVTLPVRETSPVMARSGRAGLLMARLRRAVTMVTPAEGPSLGVAPSGTCKCN